MIEKSVPTLHSAQDGAPDRMALNGSVVTRDAIMAAGISALIVVAVLTPVFFNPDVLLSKRYRGVLLLTSALASPLLDKMMLSFRSERDALFVAATVTWAINTSVLCALLIFARLLASLRAVKR